MDPEIYRSIFLAASWGLVLIVAFVGWGRLLNKTLFSACDAGWGEQAAWGMALAILVGGWLNLFGLISPPVVLGIVFGGLALVANELGRKRSGLTSFWTEKLRRYRENQCILVIAFGVLLLALLKYWGAAAGAHFSFNDMDDFTAYFAFPGKMLQTGALGLDPFSVRRVFSLGGQSFLQTFILALFPVGRLQTIDPGIPVLILLGMVSHVCTARRITPGKELFMLAFIVLSTSPVTNTSAGLTGTIFFFALCLCSREAPWQQRALLIGLLAATLCGLKSTLVPFCAIAVFLDALIRLLYRDADQPLKTAFASLLLSAGSAVIFMAPWMISMWQSSHTLLYPFLGAGYHAANQGLSFSAPINPSWIWRKSMTISNLVASYPLLAMAPAMVLWKKKQPMLIGLWAACIFVILALDVGLEGPMIDVYRYSFASLSAVTIVWMVLCMQSDERDGLTAAWIQRIASSAMLAFFIGGFLLGNDWTQVCHSVRMSMWSFERPMSSTDFADGALKNQCERAQSSLALGSTLLVRTERPYLFNFKRNRILLVDSPGGAGPPPGMPMFQGPERLADYLSSNSVRYIAYSYKNEAGFSKAKFQPLLSTNLSKWTRNYWLQILDFQDNLSALGLTRHRVFDDGSMFIIDLASRAKPAVRMQNQADGSRS